MTLTPCAAAAWPAASRQLTWRRRRGASRRPPLLRPRPRRPSRLSGGLLLRPRPPRLLRHPPRLPRRRCRPADARSRCRACRWRWPRTCWFLCRCAPPPSPALYRCRASHPAQPPAPRARPGVTPARNTRCTAAQPYQPPRCARRSTQRAPRHASPSRLVASPCSRDPRLSLLCIAGAGVAHRDVDRDGRAGRAVRADQAQGCHHDGAAGKGCGRGAGGAPAALRHALRRRHAGHLQREGKWRLANAVRCLRLR